MWSICQRLLQHFRNPWKLCTAILIIMVLLVLSNPWSNQVTHRHRYLVTMTFSSESDLGDNMYHYAALKAVALENNRTAFVTSKLFRNILDTFDITIPVYDDISSWQDWTQRVDWQYDIPNTLHRTQNLPYRNITLKGSYQSFRYFQTMKDEIRKEFTFQKVIGQRAHQYLKDNIPTQWKDKAVIRIGLHLLRSDRLTNNQKRIGYFFPSDSYFKKSFEFFTKDNQFAQFVVASDDPQWAKTYLKQFNVEFLISENNTKGQDLAILASCDHMITTLGTYSWWAGWLVTGRTIYMKDFPRNGSIAAGMFKPGYYIPEYDENNSWTGL